MRLFMCVALLVPSLLFAQNHTSHDASTHAAPTEQHGADHNAHADPGQHSDHGHADHGQHQDASSSMHAENHTANVTEAHVHKDPAPEQVPGVQEKLGQIVALDTVFLDENGTRVSMAQVIDKPTIIVPIYFNCPNVCAIIQSSLSSVLLDVKLQPGIDYQVVSVSFDETDTPAMAVAEKRNYMAAMNYKFPEKGWRFLTGDIHNIRTFLDSIGFSFTREGKDFVHPVIVVAVSPKGMVARYLYGVNPLAFDLTMAATEAAKEQTGLSIKRVLAYCFSYDPQGKRYVFNFMKITGAGVLTMLLILLVSLLVAGPKKRRSKSDNTPRG